MISNQQIKSLLTTQRDALGLTTSESVLSEDVAFLRQLLDKFPSDREAFRNRLTSQFHPEALCDALDDLFIQWHTASKGNNNAFWFVGAAYENGSDDQTSRFLTEGIWENGYESKYLDEVRAMRPGDRIAIKSAYTRKRNLPFDNKKQFVSVMAIKATGTVKHNHGDGQCIDVDWDSPDINVREWYFYTARNTVWRVKPEDWMTRGLIDFTFYGIPQDYPRFCNAPYWKLRYGDMPSEQAHFKWTLFYQEFADKLLQYKHNRSALMEVIHRIPHLVDGINPLFDQLVRGQREPLTDICPFTLMGMFNRGLTDKNRIAIATELATFLQVEAAVPTSFEGIPILNNQKSWFFSYGHTRNEHDIDNLWFLFESALTHANTPDAATAEQLSNAYEAANTVRGTGWNLTMGLYWIRPWKYVTLDTQSRQYITKRLSLTIGRNGQKNRCSADDYFGLIDDLESRFQEDNYPVHSFPELSLAAWAFQGDETSVQSTTTNSDDDADDDIEDDAAVETTSFPPYGVDNIINEGSFLTRAVIERTLSHLKIKKNLILQGAPGTGKTWLAKKLAYALMGQKNDNALRAVQFHPNLSYEDFVRGWRPSGDGKLSLVDGPFMEMIEKAKQEPNTKHVMVIEEINRGNPAQIFGEILTLLEADKRTPSEALELSYRKHQDERVHIPANLYVIGTMNLADRSLALVDLALRRRFAFVDLKPTFGRSWRDWVHDQSGLNPAFLTTIEERIMALNNDIANDRNLGAQYQIGHSFITPPLNCDDIDDPAEWFIGVVDAEIGPLLEEYWFDDVDRAIQARERLLDGL